MAWQDVTYSENHSRLTFQYSQEEIMSVRCWLTHCFILFLGHKAWRVFLTHTHAHGVHTCIPHTHIHRPLCLSQPARRHGLKKHKWQKMPIDMAASIDKSNTHVLMHLTSLFMTHGFWNQEVCHTDWQDVGRCWCLNYALGDLSAQI